MKYILTQIYSNLYFLKVKTNFDLFMFSWRTFNIKPKSFIEHIREQSKTATSNIFNLYDGMFISNPAIKNTYIDYESKIQDFNEYDEEMVKICKLTNYDCNIIISCKGINSDVLKHEIAHYLYFSNIEYRKKVNSLSEDIDVHFRMKTVAKYIEYGYNAMQYTDELNATFIGTPYFLFNEDELKYKDNIALMEPYKKLFAEYKKNSGKYLNKIILKK